GMKALDQAVGDLGFVTAIEVVGAEIAVVDVVLEHVIGGGEHGGGDGEDGFFGAAAALEAEELRTQVPVLFAGGGPGGLYERCLQPRVARARPGGQAFAGTFVETRAEPSPRDEMAGGGKAGHVEADLGDEDAGDGLADARHGDQSVESGAKGGEGLAEARLYLAHGPLEGIDVSEMQLEQEAVVGGDAPVQGGDEVGAGSLEAAVDQVRQALGILLAGWRGHC